MNNFDRRADERAKEAIKGYLTQRKDTLTMSTEGPIEFDYTKHEIGARVVELGSGRRGTVESVRETSADFVEPFVRWDNENEISLAKGRLVLEESV